MAREIGQRTARTRAELAHFPGLNDNADWLELSDAVVEALTNDALSNCIEAYWMSTGLVTRTQQVPRVSHPCLRADAEESQFRMQKEEFDGILPKLS